MRKCRHHIRSRRTRPAVPSAGASLRRPFFLCRRSHRGRSLLFRHPQIRRSGVGPGRAESAGRVHHPRAGAYSRDQRFAIRNGTAKDGVITFEIETPDGYLLKFVLKEQGDELSGTATRERNGSQGRATVLVRRVR
jgi:hypothetical protein